MVTFQIIIVIEKKTYCYHFLDVYDFKILFGKKLVAKASKFSNFHALPTPKIITKKTTKITANIQKT